MRCSRKIINLSWLFSNNSNSALSRAVLHHPAIDYFPITALTQVFSSWSSVMFVPFRSCSVIWRSSYHWQILILPTAWCIKTLGTFLIFQQSCFDALCPLGTNLFLRRQNQHPTWSSALVAHWIQSLMSKAFLGDILHTSVEFGCDLPSLFSCMILIILLCLIWAA